MQFDVNQLFYSHAIPFSLDNQISSYNQVYHIYSGYIKPWALYCRSYPFHFFIYISISLWNHFPSFNRFRCPLPIQWDVNGNCYFVHGFYLPSNLSIYYIYIPSLFEYIFVFSFIIFHPSILPPIHLGKRYIGQYRICYCPQFQTHILIYGPCIFYLFAQTSLLCQQP